MFPKVMSKRLKARDFNIVFRAEKNVFNSDFGFVTQESTAVRQLASGWFVQKESLLHAYGKCSTR
jgi:hypothetical protein